MRDRDRKLLWARAAGRCCICKASVAEIGEEAHIVARRSSGPRGDPAIPRGKLDSYDNAILLCPNCHSSIDSDPASWTVERLLKVKAQHEVWVLGPARWASERLPPPRCRQLHGRRDVVDKLSNHLRSIDPARIVMLSAFGGYGKTEVARYVADDLLRERDFTDAVWINLKREEFSLSSGRLLPTPGLGISAEDVLTEMAEQLLCTTRAEVARRLGEEAILLVIDNLESLRPDGREELISALHGLLATGPSRALVTSRFDVTVPYVYRPDFAGLSYPASAGLLVDEATVRARKSLSDFGRAESLERIWILTNGMPLALHMVVGQAQYYPLEQVIRNLEEARAEGPDEEFYRFLFMQAWNELGATARALLTYLGAATRSPQTMYQLLGIKVGTTELTPPALAKAISELFQWFLIERLEPWLVQGQTAYDLHPLTRSFILSEELRAKWQNEFAEDRLMEEASRKHAEIFKDSLQNTDD